MIGHIKLDRKILTWEWYDDANTFRVFVHLLLMATHKDGRYRGMLIKRGEVVTGRVKLAKALRLSEKQIRISLDKLKTTNEITIKTTNKYSIVTISKYDIYQSFKNYEGQQADQLQDQQETNKRPTRDQQTATFNNVNNDNNVNEKYIYNSEGAKSAPYGVPPEVIIPDKIYLAKDLNGLPKENSDSIISFLKLTKKIDISDIEVLGMWEIFKVQELTGQKLYRNKEDVYRHFLNWAKKQTFQKGVRIAKTVTDKKIKKEIKGVEFINDFSEVKMENGEIQKLTISQSESARFNLINPSSIKKQ
jgi:hypothetical protein